MSSKQKYSHSLAWRKVTAWEYARILLFQWECFIVRSMKIVFSAIALIFLYVISALVYHAIMEIFEYA